MIWRERASSALTVVTKDMHPPYEDYHLHIYRTTGVETPELGEQRFTLTRITLQYKNSALNPDLHHALNLLHEHGFKALWDEDQPVSHPLRNTHIARLFQRTWPREVGSRNWKGIWYVHRENPGCIYMPPDDHKFDIKDRWVMVLVEPINQNEQPIPASSRRAASLMLVFPGEIECERILDEYERAALWAQATNWS
jgi:hypothetical protein